MSDQTLLRLDDVQVGYPTSAGMKVVVDGLSLELQAGEIGCLLGASGCGKTTVLRAIAGFEPLIAGSLELEGKPIADAHGGMAPEQRRVGMMFQDYALFPHLDVAANVAFGLQRQPRARRAERVSELLELVGLAGSAGAYPHELSGGQQQRVALARALAPEPALLLLDEPFSNLDIDTRQRLAAELRVLLKATGTTVLMVTHDQSEAFAMADRIGVMESGRILQWDSAVTLYRRPADRFVADFIGRGSLVSAAAVGLAGGGEVLLRPESLSCDSAGGICGQLVSVGFRGPHHTGCVRLGGGEVVEVDLCDEHAAQVGAEIRLCLVGEPLLVPARPAAQGQGAGKAQ
ncbi:MULTISPECIES: ABC transporter ATP-binding protein [unclassified Luteimonas]